MTIMLAYREALLAVHHGCRHADGQHVHAPLLIITWFAALAWECGQSPEIKHGTIKCPCCWEQVQVSGP